MVWGDRPNDLNGLERYLAAGHRPRVVLAINEPNLRGQAFIPPEEAAQLYAKIKAIADRYHIPVAGPQMALGSAIADSIRAQDPLDNKEVTYTFMVPYLKAFCFYAGQTDIPSMAFHTYGSIGELHWAVEMMHKEFNRPIWVTEYAQWHTPNAAAARTYLIQATDYLERSPYVAGYSWFKERVENNNSISLLAGAPGELTPMGHAYIAVPAHDADVYYRVPGHLDAGKYVRMEGAEIMPTTDSDGLFDMKSQTPDAWLDYNIQVDTPGTYRLALRIDGNPGRIEILQRNQLLTSAKLMQGSWQTVETSANLLAGPQTIRVRLESTAQSIHAILFAKD